MTFIYIEHHLESWNIRLLFSILYVYYSLNIILHWVAIKYLNKSCHSNSKDIKRKSFSIDIIFLKIRNSQSIFTKVLILLDFVHDSIYRISHFRETWWKFKTTEKLHSKLMEISELDIQILLSMVEFWKFLQPEAIFRISISKFHEFPTRDLTASKKSIQYFELPSSKTSAMDNLSR